jgi:ParB/RepB/Spo0J family partition protein
VSKSKHASKPALKEQGSSPRSTSISEYREIETTLLLDPADAARDTLDEDALNKLILSIRRFGVLEPLLVHPEGGMYRVDAGHRRLICVRAVGLKTCPCRVFEDGAEFGEAMKHHENACREDLNPAQEARHFQRLLENLCGGDTDRLCELVQERRDYVEARLLLIQGDPRIFQALSDGALKIGVAQELNKIADPARRMMYLECAMQGGASVRMVRDWRIRGNMDDAAMGVLSVPDNPTETPQQLPVPALYLQCYVCAGTEDAHEMEILYIHRSCAKAMQRFAARDAAAAAADERGS